MQCGLCTHFCRSVLFCTDCVIGCNILAPANIVSLELSFDIDSRVRSVSGTAFNNNKNHKFKIAPCVGSLAARCGYRFSVVHPPPPKVIGTLFQRRQCSGRCVTAVYVSEAYTRPLRDFINIRSYQYIIVMVPKKQRFTSLLRIASIAFWFRFKRVLMQCG